VRPTQQLDLTTKESIPSPTKQSCQDNKSTNKTKMTAGSSLLKNFSWPLKPKKRERSGSGGSWDLGQTKRNRKRSQLGRKSSEAEGSSSSLEIVAPATSDVEFKYTWPIDNFLHQVKNCRGEGLDSKPFEVNVNGVLTTWTLSVRFWVGENGERLSNPFVLCLNLVNCKDDGKQVWVKYRFGILNRTTEEAEMGPPERVSLKEKSGEKLHSVGYKNIAMNEKHVNAAGDVLLFVRLSIIREEEAVHSLSSDLGSLINDEKSSDLILQAGERKFMVHRNILAARSPVFADLLARMEADDLQHEANILQHKTDDLRLLDANNVVACLRPHFDTLNVIQGDSSGVSRLGESGASRLGDAGPSRLGETGVSRLSNIVEMHDDAEADEEPVHREESASNYKLETKSVNEDSESGGRNDAASSASRKLSVGDTKLEGDEKHDIHTAQQISNQTKEDVETGPGLPKNKQHEVSTLVTQDYNTLRTIGHSTKRIEHNDSLKRSDEKENIFSDLDSSPLPGVVVGLQPERSDCSSIKGSTLGSVTENRIRSKAKLGSESRNRLVIDDLPGDTVEELLKYIYTDNSHNVESFSQTLLAASERYKLPGLKQDCEKHLGEIMSPLNVSDILLLSDNYSCAQLKKAALLYCGENHSYIMKDSKWKLIEAENPVLFEEAIALVAPDTCNKHAECIKKGGNRYDAEKSKMSLGGGRKKSYGRKI